jgi:hypothetical protein
LTGATPAEMLGTFKPSAVPLEPTIWQETAPSGGNVS